MDPDYPRPTAIAIDDDYPELYVVEGRTVREHVVPAGAVRPTDGSTSTRCPPRTTGN